MSHEAIDISYDKPLAEAPAVKWRGALSLSMWIRPVSVLVTTHSAVLILKRLGFTSRKSCWKIPQTLVRLVIQGKKYAEASRVSVQLHLRILWLLQAIKHSVHQQFLSSPAAKVLTSWGWSVMVVLHDGRGNVKRVQETVEVERRNCTHLGVLLFCQSKIVAAF